MEGRGLIELWESNLTSSQSKFHCRQCTTDRLQLVDEPGTAIDREAAPNGAGSSTRRPSLKVQMFVFNYAAVGAWTVRVKACRSFNFRNGDNRAIGNYGVCPDMRATFKPRGAGLKNPSATVADKQFIFLLGEYGEHRRIIAN